MLQLFGRCFFFFGLKFAFSVFAFSAVYFPKKTFTSAMKNATCVITRMLYRSTALAEPRLCHVTGIREIRHMLNGLTALVVPQFCHVMGTHEQNNASTTSKLRVFAVQVLEARRITHLSSHVVSRFLLSFIRLRKEKTNENLPVFVNVKAIIHLTSKSVGLLLQSPKPRTHVWIFDVQIELEFRSVGFYGGRKTGQPGEKPSEQGENQQQTQPTWDHHSRALSTSKSKFQLNPRLHKWFFGLYWRPDFWKQKSSYRRWALNIVREAILAIMLLTVNLYCSRILTFSYSLIAKKYVKKFTSSSKANRLPLDRWDKPYCLPTLMN